MWVVRWWETAKRPETELLAVMMHVRFAVMVEGFLCETVVLWFALGSAGAQSILANAVRPAADSMEVVPRSGCGPRLIYVVGGSGDGQTEFDPVPILSTVQLFDPQKASWTQLAAMAGRRCAHGCVALGGKLYAVGGLVITAKGLDTAEVYDPQTDGWQPLAKMSTARAALGLAAVGGGKIYAIGGSRVADR